MKHRMLEGWVARALNRMGIPPGSTLLLGLSGGRDSITLLQILHNLGYKVTAAHVNYGLRGDASDSDEQFCLEFCCRLGVPILRLSAGDMMKAATPLGKQALARKIRYAWFREIARESGAMAIVTAHHAGDQEETVLLNLLRGNSSRLTVGIPEQAGLVVRPLLNAQPDWIDAYAKEMGLAWREDLSNQEPVYLRNRIRNELLPLLNDIYPGTGRKLQKRASAAFTRRMQERQLAEQLTPGSDLHRFSIPPWFRESPDACLWLLERWAERFGIGSAELSIIRSLLNEKVGMSKATGEDVNWVREQFAITRRNQGQDWEAIQISAPGSGSCTTGTLHMEWKVRSGGYLGEVQGFQMDTERIHWPVLIRRWNSGDSVTLYRGPGRQKVSDILQGLGIRGHQKRSFAIVEDQEGIIAVMGARIANRVAIRPDTGTVFWLNIISTHG